jgi:hypothetical protein
VRSISEGRTAAESALRQYRARRIIRECPQRDRVHLALGVALRAKLAPFSDTDAVHRAARNEWCTDDTVVSSARAALSGARERAEFGWLLGSFR